MFGLQTSFSFDKESEWFSRFSDSSPKVSKTILVQEATADVPVPSLDSQDSLRVITIEERLGIKFSVFESVFGSFFSQTCLEESMENA